MPGEKKPYINFERLKEAVSMEMVLNCYGLLGAMTRKNECSIVGRCPISESTSTTAFKVDTCRNIWYSFKLQAGGNVLDFVRHMEDVDVRRAAELIVEWFGFEGERGDGAARPATIEASSDAPDGFPLNVFGNALYEATEQMKYAVAGLPLSDEEKQRLIQIAQETFHEGYALGVDEAMTAVSGQIQALEFNFDATWAAFRQLNAVEQGEG